VALTSGNGSCGQSRIDWPRYSRGKYAAAQREAQQAERRVWSGSYLMPWAYRACKRDGGRLSDCSDDANLIK